MIGGYRIELDPWAPDYGGELGVLLEDGAQPDPTVNPSLEVPFDEWQPIAPSNLPGNELLVFIDGVRRLDARVTAQRDGRLFYGAFGSYAVGSVSVQDSRAAIDEKSIRLHRIFVLGGAPPSPTSPLTPARALVYEPLVIDDPEPDGPVREIHKAMQRAESDLLRAHAAPSAALVIADGPLEFQLPNEASALGYVKRMLRQYLGQAGFSHLMNLPPGSRTPIFEIRRDKSRRLSWYARLGTREAGESRLSGVVRLECSPMDLKSAQALANRSVGELGRFVPSRARDPRSPQNLLPIGALERILRHRLGDARLVRRNITTMLARDEKSHHDQANKV